MLDANWRPRLVNLTARRAGCGSDSTGVSDSQLLKLGANVDALDTDTASDERQKASAKGLCSTLVHLFRYEQRPTVGVCTRLAVWRRSWADVISHGYVDGHGPLRSAFWADTLVPLFSVLRKQITRGLSQRGDI